MPFETPRRWRSSPATTVSAIDGTKEHKVEDGAEGWETCLALDLAMPSDNGAQGRLTASDAYVALHAGPDLRVDEVPCNIW